MRPVNLSRSGEFAELYPHAEENPAVSKVFFRETVVFRDLWSSRSGSPPN